MFSWPILNDAARRPGGMIDIVGIEFRTLGIITCTEVQIFAISGHISTGSTQLREELSILAKVLLLPVLFRFFPGFLSKEFHGLADQLIYMGLARVFYILLHQNVSSLGANQSLLHQSMPGPWRPGKDCDRTRCINPFLPIRSDCNHLRALSYSRQPAHDPDVPPPAFRPGHTHTPSRGSSPSGWAPIILPR